MLVQEPQYPWEFVKLGNCGSPIETEAGWLVLTDGVGPMRRSCIGATSLICTTLQGSLASSKSRS